MHPRQLSILDYTYDLPQERIARFPLPGRDQSKLLVYRQGKITEDVYRHIDQHLPADSLLVFNQTRVVAARLLFRKPTGATIEVFCLEPHEQYPDVSTAMAQKQKVWWKCMIGGASKWKHGMVLLKQVDDVLLEASIIDRGNEAFVVELRWSDPSLSFAEVLQKAGAIPLPPYLHREAEVSDQERYQTIYAREEGSVAAPTAGLHFTDEVFEKLRQKNIRRSFVTLHVGAGTFKPVKAETMEGHEMHAEFIEVERSFIEELLRNAHHPIVAVGTTSLRTIESLYWLGAKVLLAGGKPDKESAVVNQWDAYELPAEASREESLKALLGWLEQQGLSKLITKTRMIIAPGYDLKIASGLITNFHQPQSTLLLLVAAITGKDWRNIYDYALEHDFRFLSYGDGSLLWKS